ncbi:MAG: hypothetical protein AAF683_15260, partial [Pseudomonadota bacterium]
MKIRMITAASVFALAACGGGDPSTSGDNTTDSASSESSDVAARPAANPDRNAYFGDLHIHTRNS